GAARHLHRRRRAFDRGDLEIGAKRGLRRRDTEHVHEVVALAPEQLVLPQPDEDVEIARRAAAKTGFAFARDAELLPVVDPRGDVEWKLVVAALAALAAATRGQRVGVLAGAAAAGARRRGHDAAECL